MATNQPETAEQANRKKFVDFVELLVQEAECRLQENLEKRIASWEKWLEEEKEQLDHKDKTDLTEAVGSVKRGMLMEGKMLKRIKRSIKAQRRLSELMSGDHSKNQESDPSGSEGNNDSETDQQNGNANPVISTTETRDTPVTPDDSVSTPPPTNPSPRAGPRVPNVRSEPPNMRVEDHSKSVSLRPINKYFRLS